MRDLRVGLELQAEQDSKHGLIQTTTLAAVGAAILALTLAGLSLHLPHADSVGSEQRTNVFVAIAACAGAGYLVACALVLRLRAPPRGVLWLVLGIALAMRLPVLLAPPFLSSDLYRYVWDGRVQAAGINPYRYIPADPALAPLRDPAIYPHINRRDYAPTIYPPMAQVIFRAVAAIGQSALAIKTAMVGFECLAIACLIGLLRIARLPTARVLIYAWNPLAVWAFAGNGHIDAAAVGLIAAALLCRALRRDGLAGAVLGGAVLVKFLPLAIAPALWRPWSRRARWQAPLAGLAVIVGLYACYISVGAGVFGFLSNYSSEEGITQGGGVWVLAGLGELIAVPPSAGHLYLLFCGSALMAMALTMLVRSRAALPPADDTIRFCAQAGWLAATFMIVLSPHYSWYFPFLAVFATIAPIRMVLWLSVAPLLLDLAPFHDHFFWRSLVYAPAVILAVMDLRRRETKRSPMFAVAARNS